MRPASDATVFLQMLAGFAIVALVMLGVGGTLYKLMAPGGWMTQFLGSNFAGGFAAFLALVGMGLIAWLTREWTSPLQRNRLSEIFVYGAAGAGALYAARLFMSGTI
jgi:hypothetical protein